MVPDDLPAATAEAIGPKLIDEDRQLFACVHFPGFQFQPDTVLLPLSMVLGAG